MAIWTVTILPENVSAVFKDARDVAYVRPDGSELPAVFEPVWCGRCGRVTNGEQIETVDVLDRIVAHRQNPRSIHHDPLQEPDPARAVTAWGKDLRLFNAYPRPADLERRRAWLSVRRSPPKCLQCGSTDIVPFPFCPATPEVPHPRGQGWLHLHSPRLADYWGDWPSRLTPEGGAIRGRPPRRWRSSWPFRSRR